MMTQFIENNPHGKWRPRYFMMTSSNGNIFRDTGPLCGEFTGPGEFPAQRPVTRSFDVYFDLRLNKRLSKQWWGWWFGTQSCSLWRQSNAYWINTVLYDALAVERGQGISDHYIDIIFHEKSGLRVRQCLITYLISNRQNIALWY